MKNWKGIVEKAYVDAEITGNKAKAAGIVYSSQNGGNNNTLGKEGTLRNSVAKGSIELKEAVMSGGLLGTNWALGAIEDNITMMKLRLVKWSLVILILMLMITLHTLERSATTVLRV